MVNEMGGLEEQPPMTSAAAGDRGLTGREGQWASVKTGQAVEIIWDKGNGIRGHRSVL